MGQRIRHLEYYGYNDQNVYIGLPNMDLSDIHKTNREQDREISEISGATRDKADISMVQELSGHVDSFIHTQSHINKKMIGAIKASFDNIDELKKRDKKITDKINEIGDKFDPIYDQLGAVSDDVHSLEEKLNKHLSESGNLDELEALISDKLSKSEADEMYAKKEDTYTKDEVDKAISDSVDGLASQDWVYSKKYISEDDADAKYASKARLNALDDKVNDVYTKLNNQYNELNTSFTNFKNDVNTKVDAVYGRVETLEKKHDREITNLQNKDIELQEQVNANKSAIKEINEVSLPNKVDKSAFNDLLSDVSDISKELSNKVDVSIYEKDKANFGNSLDRLDDKKADKTALNEVRASVEELEGKLALEAQKRENEDLAIRNQIKQVENKINDIIEDNLDRDAAMSDIESKLEKEIADRKDADDKIIGSEDDKADTLSIYGTRKYAETAASSAVKKAKKYADEIGGEIRTYVDEKDKELDLKITAKADKAYVNAIRDEIESSFSSKLADEIERAENEESRLSSALALETAERIKDDSAIRYSLNHTTNIVRAITDWDGDDRKDYTDVGNGILDVLHREFHNFKQSMPGFGKGIKITKENEIAFGSYNESNTGPNTEDNTIFSVGVGTSDSDRKNAVELRENGDLYLWIEGEFMPINNLLAMLAHETY